MTLATLTQGICRISFVLVLVPGVVVEYWPSGSWSVLIFFQIRGILDTNIHPLADEVTVLSREG
jgi:hypothetical protein